MFDNLKEKILGSTMDIKMEKKLVAENDAVNRYSLEVISVSDSAYICSMGARICYGLKVDESYAKNRAHIARIVGMGHDSVSAHSNVIALIGVKGDCTEDLMQIMPAVKYMNIVKLSKTIKADAEDGEDTVENYLLVSGSVRAFRYFFTTYDYYNDTVSPLARFFLRIASENFEKEFFENILKDTKLFANRLDQFEYLAPLMIDVKEVKNPETGEIEEIADISDDSGTMHYEPICSDRVNIVYADYIIGVIVELVTKFPDIDKDTLIKAAFDTCIVTTVLHDYSRAISQQINRHQSGISQESQRYVDYSKSQFVDPLQFDAERYDIDNVYNVSIDGKDIDGTSAEIGTKLQSVYHQLKEQGMLAQDARSFLPFNVKTKSMHTWTLTNFLHFIAVRTGKAAQPEVRLIAKEMVKNYKLALDRMVDEIDPEYAELALDICNRIKDYIDSISSKDKMVIYYNNEKVEV